MRTIRGLRNAQRSIVDRVASLDPPSTQICSKPKLACCSATEASVRSIVAAAFRLTVTIESSRSMGCLLDFRTPVHGIFQNAANEGLANVASCIMPSLHKTARHALVEPLVSSEIRNTLTCPDAGGVLVGAPWLSRPHGGRADLCISGVCEASSATHSRSVSAKHLAGSIHFVFAAVRVLYWVTGIGERGSTAHPGFYRLVLGGRLELCSFCHRTGGRLVGGRVSLDHRRRLWLVRRVPNF